MFTSYETVFPTTDLPRNWHFTPHLRELTFQMLNQRKHVLFSDISNLSLSDTHKLIWAVHAYTFILINEWRLVCVNSSLPIRTVLHSITKQIKILINPSITSWIHKTILMCFIYIKILAVISKWSVLTCRQCQMIQSTVMWFLRTEDVTNLSGK